MQDTASFHTNIKKCVVCLVVHVYKHRDLSSTYLKKIIYYKLKRNKFKCRIKAKTNISQSYRMRKS